MSKAVAAGAVSLGLLAGGCSPATRPLGIVSGGVLTVAGTVLLASAATSDCSSQDDPLGGVVTAVACASVEATLTLYGGLTALTGLAILIGALASPSGEASAAAPAAPARVPAASPDAPWSPTPPARSPSAPSGSPLQPVASRSLRPAAERPSLMAFP